MVAILRQAIISIGSNVPDKEARVSTACTELKSHFPSFTVSSLYTIPAVGKCIGQPDYCNAVARFLTAEEYDSVKNFFKQMEIRFGRCLERGCQTLVALDIDIVVWEGQVLRPDDVTQEYMRIGLRQLGLL
ncbi:MAG: 2-amino-4-hydroxy-6-hydroxymethyldihydropteridine diphosphokinase [Porphyromonadaceae bacterium]|nr:2-amino-4-hydroxy-6-hydroxymethyldihydropteridine diphosphokinase [Porphyromonadaceae bacterium]